MKKTVALWITFFVGMVMIVEKFVPHPPFNHVKEDLSIFFDILASFAFILGGGNLLKIHLKKTSRMAAGWGYSLVIIVAFAVTLLVGLFKIGGPPGILHPLEAEGAWYQQIYEYLFKPLQATMFSLLAFFVASASYRAFRAKNKEATMLLITAFVILFGRTAYNTSLTQWFPGCIELFFGALFAWMAYGGYRAKQTVTAPLLGAIATFFFLRTFYGWFLGADDFAFITIPKFVNWIMLVPQMAGQRAIMIGICLGVMSMSLRLILGIERSHLGTDTE